MRKFENGSVVYLDEFFPGQVPHKEEWERKKSVKESFTPEYLRERELAYNRIINKRVWLKLYYRKPCITPYPKKHKR